MGIFQDIKKSSFKEDDAIRIFRVLYLCTLPDSYGVRILRIRIRKFKRYICIVFHFQLLDLRGPLNYVELPISTQGMST